MATTSFDFGGSYGDFRLELGVELIFSKIDHLDELIIRNLSLNRSAAAFGIGIVEGRWPPMITPG